MYVIPAEISQAKRFNELSDETKGLVRELYMNKKLDYYGGYLDEKGISRAEGALDALSYLFGEENLQTDKETDKIWNELSPWKRLFVSNLYKRCVEDSQEDSEAALVAPKTVIETFHLLFGKKNLNG